MRCICQYNNNNYNNDNNNNNNSNNNNSNNNNNNNNNRDNNQYFSRVTPLVLKTVINGGPDIQSKLEFRSVDFFGRSKKLEKLEKDPLEQGENQEQTQPTCDGKYKKQTQVKEVRGKSLSTACRSRIQEGPSHFVVIKSCAM